MLALAQGSAYIERPALSSPSGVLKTKKAIAKAFQIQLDGVGFSLVEVLSPCPTNWRMSPVDSCKWIDEVMTASFPLGVLKDVGDKKDAD
jgi:2-oxoglutarate ferredoxin oxidoreductase subunit beta